MLKPIPFANALAATTALFYFVLWLLGLALPKLFAFLVNAQYFGSDVSSLYPANFNFVTSLVSLIVLTGIAWLMGFIWASLYNRWKKD